jgi:hypothetical protein
MEQLNINKNLRMSNSQQLTHLWTMQIRQEPTLTLGLAVYTHCVELYKSKRGEAADRPQSLLVKSSMLYLQENVFTHKFLRFALVT